MIMIGTTIVIRIMVTWLRLGRLRDCEWHLEEKKRAGLPYNTAIVTKLCHHHLNTFTPLSNVFPRMLPIYLQWQGANVFVAIKAGTGKALRDALGGTRGGEQGQN